MNSAVRGFPKTALALFVFGIVGLALLLAFHPYLQDRRFVDPEGVVWGILLVELIAAILGLTSRGSTAGKVGGFGGLSVVVLVMLWFFSGSDASPSSSPGSQRDRSPVPKVETRNR
ncbi:MAG: hypothetical protein V1809_16535 [Planctomycetota bacterium]